MPRSQLLNHAFKTRPTVIYHYYNLIIAEEQNMLGTIISCKPYI